MKHITIGILAHVDAGKTTMAEALLYRSGAIKNPGRVDHGNAYLDTRSIERERGITIFSKQAIFPLGNFCVTLLDTPGHMDFSSEMERTLSVLDCAILIISAPDGVQPHTATLWNLLERYRIPVFIWVNKMDICDVPPEEIMKSLREKLDEGCTDFSAPGRDSEAALCGEEALEEFLENSRLSPATLSHLINSRTIFPCRFGSALKFSGIDAFMEDLALYMRPPLRGSSFGGRIFKISREKDGARLSWLKLTGGTLKNRDVVSGEKITGIRLYSGARFTAASEMEPGQIAALTGLSNSYAGQGVGSEADSGKPLLEPALSYTLSPADGTDAHRAYSMLSQLGEEDPQLNISWEEKFQEIQLRLMGPVQTEVMRQLIKDRFGMEVVIGEGRISYRETVASPALGIGHYEPARHYAEVHLLIEPLPAGTGVVVESACPQKMLGTDWQNAILSALREVKHRGVLTDSPLTDIKISLVAGRAHPILSEAGDFRQAAFRALRQGLMGAENLLLEPVYGFRLEVPADSVGRVISDLKAMQANFDGPRDSGGNLLFKGTAPVSKMENYQIKLLSCTGGLGRLSCRFAGYAPCPDQDRQVSNIGYDPLADGYNPSDSVFFSHGAALSVSWDKVGSFAHLDSGIKTEGGRVLSAEEPRLISSNLDLDEKELEAILAKQFGPSKAAGSYASERGVRRTAQAAPVPQKQDCIIVDGYNMIFAWGPLKALAAESLASAREALLDKLSNYRAFRGCRLMLVFDGYKQKGGEGQKEEVHGIHLVYTREGESADHFIEKMVGEIGKNYRVSVATSDSLIQLTALRMGVRRMSARELEFEVEKASEEIRSMLGSGRGGKKLGELVDFSLIEP